jgi:CHAT domain-containing protein/tetratricopeptide (TPR) repeat protein
MYSRVALVLLLSPLVCRAAAPPGRLSSRQQRQLDEARRLFRQAAGLGQARTAERIDRLRRGLTLERAVWGEVRSLYQLESLAELREREGQFEPALAERREALALQMRRHGKSSWQATDARLELACHRRLAGLPASKRKRWFEAHDQANRALHLGEGGESQRALPLNRKALRTLGEMFGPDTPEYLTVQNNLSQNYLGLGDLDRAKELCERVARRRRELLGPQHPFYGLTLSNLADICTQKGEPGRALPLLEEASHITRSALGAEDFRHLVVLNNLALTHQALGCSDRSRDILEGLLVVRRRVLGEKHPHYLATLNNLGLACRDLGDYARARRLLEQAADLSRRHLGAVHPGALGAENNLGLVCTDLGELDRAREILVRLVGVRRRLLGEQHPHYQASLGNLAELYRRRGEPDRALPLAEDAARLSARWLGEEHPAHLTALNNLALTWSELGQSRRALETFEQLASVRQRVLGERHADYLATLHNLALEEATLGRTEQARRRHERVIRALEERHGEGHPHLLAALSRHAHFLRADEPWRARRLLLRVYRLRLRHLGGKHPQVAEDLYHLALVHLDAGDVYRAHVLLERAWRGSRSVLGDRHAGVLAVLEARALVGLLQRRLPEAAEMARDSLERTRQHLDGSFSVLGGTQRLGLTMRLRYRLNLYLMLAALTGRPVAERYEACLLWKGATLSRHVEERMVRDVPALAALWDDLQAARVRLARHATRLPDPKQQAAWVERMENLTRERDRQEARLARASSAFRNELRLRRIGVRDVRQALPAGVALVDVIRVRSQSGAAGKANFDRYLAFVVRRDRPVVLADLGPGGEIDRLVGDWRDAVTASPPRWPADSTLRRLRERLWAPLEKTVAGCPTVLVAPDDRLTLFPFAALPGRKPGTYLLEEVALGHVSSSRELLEQPGPAAKRGGLLALGGLNYGKPRPGRPGREELPPLPGSRLEVDRLCSGYRKAMPEGPLLQLTGSRGAKPALLAALAARTDRPRWLHLATHGFRIALPDAKRLLEEGEAARLGQPAPDASLSGAPLVLSRLALSGANSDPEKGLITAEEVAGLDLRGAELVVLSSCESALGAVLGGEGVLGLQRAFHQAGARATVASLWNVSDPATSLLMERFYEILWGKKKVSKLEALRQAQLFVLSNPDKVTARARELRDQGGAVLSLRSVGKTAAVLPKGKAGDRRSHPAWWAAFVLSGAP